MLLYFGVSVPYLLNNNNNNKSEEMMAKVMKASGCLILWQSPVSFVLVFSWAKVVQIRIAGLLVSLSPCVSVEHQNGLPASASALPCIQFVIVETVESGRSEVGVGVG